MMKKGKRVLSVLVTLCILVGALGIGMFSAGAAKSPVPVVYVQGQGAALYADSNNINSEIIFNDNSVLNQVFDYIPELVPYLVDAYRTNDFTAYNDKLVEIYTPFFEKIALDVNGEASNGTGNKCLQTLPTYNTYNNGYDIKKDYYFWYDWRLDPVVTAEWLNEYIDGVLAVTHTQKVNLVGRCLGANIVLAYLHEYGHDKINDLVLYASPMEGSEMFGALFSGDIVVNPDSLERFMNATVNDDDEDMRTVRALIGVANSSFALQWGIDEIMDFYEKVYLDVLPRLLKVSHGSFPSFWSMVGDEYYERAKEVNFGDDPELHAEMIRKIDYYHYNIYQHTEEILTECINDGVDIQVIAKYGYQLKPICRESEVQSDDTFTVVSMSMGCTASGMGKTLGTEYLENAQKNGTAKYISADNQIDASTCFLPDSTWFIKDLRHDNMTNTIDYGLITEFFISDGKMTVSSNPDYPQYLKYDNDTHTVAPLTTENQKGAEEQKQEGNRWEDFMFLFNKIVDFCTNLFTGFFAALSSFLEGLGVGGKAIVI